MTDTQIEFRTIKRKSLEENLFEFETGLLKNLKLNKGAKILVELNKQYDNCRNVLINNQIMIRRDEFNDKISVVNLEHDLLTPIEIKNNSLQFKLRNKDQAFTLSKDIYDSFMANFAKLIWRNYQKFKMRRQFVVMIRRIKGLKFIFKAYSVQILRSLCCKICLEITFIQRFVRGFLIRKEVSRLL